MSRPKPFKGTVARTPMRQPPTAAALERTGAELMKMRRELSHECGVKALERAMPLAARRGLQIVEEHPYQSGAWWMFVVRKVAA
jgi:hypothetical protein